jgi:hypothetical protein
VWWSERHIRSHQQCERSVRSLRLGAERAARADAAHVVAVHPAGIPADEYKQAGVTWLVEGIYPEGDWIDELQASIRRGPRN